MSIDSMLNIFRYWKGEDAEDAGGADEMTASTSLRDLPAPADQLQSPLFQLPAEIRVMIWEYAMGGELIHIEHSPTLHCHEPRPPPVPVAWAQLHREERLACGKTWAQKESLTHLNWHFTSSVCGRNATLPDGQVVPKGALLGLLLSCKRIYDEASSFLYPGNVFDFRSPRDFICFKESPPPSRQNAIRFVHMRVEIDLGRVPPDWTNWVALPPPNWDRACAALREMQGLEGVQFTIRSPPDRYEGPNQMGRARQVEALFRPLVGQRLRGDMRLLMFFEDRWLRRVLVERESPFELRTEAPWQDCDVVFAS